MSLRRKAISRRTMLRGTGGAALALPALEIMHDAGKAVAAGNIAPKRYVVCYFGFSPFYCYRMQNYPKNRFDMFVVPEGVGRMDKLKPTNGLKPIYDLGVQSDMGIVSGLKIRIAGKAGPHDIPAGISWGFHGGSFP